MRFILGKAFAVALILASLVPGSASAAPLGPQSDAVLGGGKTFSDILNIDAHVNPNGKIMGHIDAKNVADYTPTFTIIGTVSCLNVVGNRASIGGELTTFQQDGWPNPQNYHGWLFYVEDNSATGLPDKISYEYIYLNPVTTCPAPFAGSAFFPMLEGNINVHKSQ